MASALTWKGIAMTSGRSLFGLFRILGWPPTLLVDDIDAAAWNVALDTALAGPFLLTLDMRLLARLA